MLFLPVRCRYGLGVFTNQPTFLHAAGDVGAAYPLFTSMTVIVGFIDVTAAQRIALEIVAVAVGMRRCSTLVPLTLRMRRLAMLVFLMLLVLFMLFVRIGCLAMAGMRV